LIDALPSWGCFLTAELSGEIDAFLRRAHQCHWINSPWGPL